MVNVTKKMVKTKSAQQSTVIGTLFSVFSQLL